MELWKLLIAVLGGFQFGYAVAIMASAILFLTPAYNLGLTQQGFVVSSVLMGALAGSLAGGDIADFFGRKKGQQGVALLFFIGALMVSLATDVTVIILGRIIQGVALGIISVIGPMYIAEMAPSKERGKLVAYYQLALTLGILVAYGTGYMLSGNGSWRMMFALSLIPAVVHFVGFIFLPDSKKPVKASTKVSTQESKFSWKALLDPVYQKPLLIALFISSFQQLTGINAVLYFAPSIFKLCGFHTASQAIFSAVLIGAVNFFSTIISLFLIDTKGRKFLLQVGLSGMIVALLFLSLAFFPRTPASLLATFSLMLYIACFAISLGPIPQLMISELFPQNIRAKAYSLCMLVSWICNFLVVFTFMDLSHLLSQSGIFFLYGLFSLATLLFVWIKTPETKGIVLE
ncbi:MAG: sugar porter family MFS transporter [Candidatus Rhabdochlamydia sp.]